MSSAKKAKALARIQAAQMYLLQGVSYTQITKILAAHYHLSERQIERDIAKAKELFRLDDMYLKEQHELAYAQLQHVKGKALQNDEDERVLRCLKLEKQFREEYCDLQIKSKQSPTTRALPDSLVQALQKTKE